MKTENLALRTKEWFVEDLRKTFLGSLLGHIELLLFELEVL